MPEKELTEEMVRGMEKEFWGFAGNMYGVPMNPLTLRAYLRQIGILLNFCPSCMSLDVTHDTSLDTFQCAQCGKLFKVVEVSE